MSRVLTIQHASINPPGLLGDILDAHHISYDVLQAENEKIPSNLTGYHALVIFGGLEHVYDEPQKPHISQEKQLIQHALSHDIPFLGICFGCQLLASALGANVYPCSPARLGFLRILLTDAGRVDSLYQGLPDNQQAFQWHDDLFDLPDNAILLANNDQHEPQSFRYGKNAYGAIYHLELTSSMLQNWLEDPASQKEFISKAGKEDYKKTDQERDELYPIYREHTSHVINNFLRLSGLL
jgi:GMP synthase (glutamine-hydrolysing)